MRQQHRGMMDEHCDFRTVSERPGIVFIEDLDRGNKSVTNDAEWVVWEMMRAGHRKDNTRIIYKDSMGQWAELVHEGSVFKGFAHYSGETPGFWRWLG